MSHVISLSTQLTFRSIRLSPVLLPQADHVKLGNKFSSAERKLDKLAAKAANAPAGPDISIITKELESEITELKVGSCNFFLPFLMLIGMAKDLSCS